MTVQSGESLAHRAFRSMRSIPSGRDAIRMMQRMGMETKTIEDVREVTIRTGDRRLVIDAPTVMSIVMQGQTIFQIAGGTVREESSTEPALSIPQGDVEIVAQQAGVSEEEARKALEASAGDLAQAIVS
ncbi:MAG: nascent polypeptide-associated complex protein, partial [Candidatus Bathyarchaeia archaeon]